MNFMKHIPRKIAMALITFYRYAISPALPASCRYIPTCSEYALTAFERYGFIKGFYLSVKRIGRCHPWHEGGYDPVP
jgi:putative membrane protein insertion efficiency factor